MFGIRVILPNKLCPCMHRFHTFYRRLGSLARCAPLAVLVFSLGTALTSAQTVSNSADGFEALATSAAAAREADKPEEAIRDYQKALAIRPTWTEGWWYLGSLQYDSDYYSAAIMSFERVLQLAPQLGAAWNFLGLCEFETGHYEHALVHLEKGQALGGGEDAETTRVSTYHLALLLIRNSEFDRASALLTSTFVTQQITPQIKVAMGLALLRVALLPNDVDPSKDALVHSGGEAAAMAAQGEAAQARELLQKMLKDYANIPYLHYAYGIALASAGQQEAALAQQQEETKISPQSALPWIQISTLQMQRHPEQAFLAAQKAVLLAPDSAAAHRALAESLQALGKQDRAAEEFQTAEKFSPEKSQPDNRVAQLYSRPALGTATAGAESGRQASDAAAQFQLAMRNYSAGQYSEAVSMLKTYVGQKPNDGTAWAVMGLAEFEMKDYDNARIHLERGNELGFGGSPDSVQLARYRLGILLNRSGKFENANIVMAPSAQSGPLVNEVQFALGMSLLRMAMLPEQVGTSQRTLVQTSGEIAVLLENSKYDDAFAKFQLLSKQYPSVPFLHYAYGTALEALSQYDEAEAQMREELKLSSASALPYVRLASIALKRHRPADALPSAQRAVQLAPDSAEAHYLLGRSFLQLGQEDAAIHELEMAGKLSPGSPEVHFNLAKAYAKARQSEKAEQERAMFVRLNAQAEQQRSAHGSQSYSGPRQATEMSVPAAANSEVSPH